MLTYWDRRLIALHYAPEDGGAGDGEGDDGDGAGGGAAKGNSNGGSGAKAPWSEEFGDTFDPEKAWKALTDIRTAERALRRENGTLKSQVKGFEDKDKTETERLQGELEELRGKVSESEKRERQASIRTTVAEEARKVGAIYPDDIFRLLEEGEIKLDNDGKVTNAPALVKALKEARPALFGRTGVDAHTARDNGRTPQSTDMNSAIRRMAGRA